MALLTRGQLAERSGVHAETVRYYERLGLLPRPQRSRAGYRQYPLEAVNRVRLVRWAGDLGFTLAEIARLLGSPERGRNTRLREMVRARVERLDLESARLASLRRELMQLANCGCEGECPIVVRAISRPARRRPRATPPSRRGGRT